MLANHENIMNGSKEATICRHKFRQFYQTHDFIRVKRETCSGSLSVSLSKNFRTIMSIPIATAIEIKVNSGDWMNLTHRRTVRRDGWRTKFILLIFSMLLFLIAAEVAARAFWCLRYGVPFFNPGRILYAYYPELEKVDAEQPRRDDGFYDILFLDGSVLNAGWRSGIKMFCLWTRQN